MTQDQFLDYLLREARPTYRLDVDTNPVVPVPGEPGFVTGRGREGAARILSAAARFGFGTVAHVAEFPESDYADFDRIMLAQHFRAWDKFGTAFGRTWVKAMDDLGYGSHTAVLVGAVARTSGPVLELGSGHASTPVLHELCGAQGRHLTTVDSDLAWLSRFQEMGRTLLHRVEHDFDPSETIHLDPMVPTWSVVFVDHSPGETRAHAIKRACDRAEYVVVHDTEELGYGLESVLSSFKWRRDFRRHRPWTTVVSMMREVW